MKGSRTSVKPSVCFPTWAGAGKVRDTLRGFPPEFTTTAHNNPLLEQFLRWPTVVLLTIRVNCSPFGSKPAHLSGHLPACLSRW
jgi:hypothetical protein